MNLKVKISKELEIILRDSDNKIHIFLYETYLARGYLYVDEYHMNNNHNNCIIRVNDTITNEHAVIVNLRHLTLLEKKILKIKLKTEKI